MKKILLTITILSHITACQAISWQELFTQVQPFVPTQTFELLQKQLYAWQTNNPIKIVHPDVKCIPIYESGEAVVDVYTTQNPRIFMLPQPDTPYSGTDCNAGLTGSSKMRDGLYQCLERMIEMLDIYAPLFTYKEGQLSIAVFEAIRDISYQELLFNNKATEIAQTYPTWTQLQVFEETCKWVSPVINNVPTHSTGGAIDIRLYDNIDHQLIDMGMFDVINGDNPTAPTFYEDICDAQKYNRLLFVLSATAAGMVNYQFEWWHFSYGDRYASYWLESDASKRVAIYGAAKI